MRMIFDRGMVDAQKAYPPCEKGDLLSTPETRAIGRFQWTLSERIKRYGSLVLDLWKPAR